MPDPQSCSEREWADYLFMEENKKGIVKEWWLHAPTSYWFIAERNRATNEIIKTCPASELFSDRIDFKGGQP
jgi:sarcosine oxidase subunit delta